jgi:hypothetical protein
MLSAYYALTDAGWSSSVARRAHNPKVVGSNPAPATKSEKTAFISGLFFVPNSAYNYKEKHPSTIFIKMTFKKQCR